MWCIFARLLALHCKICARFQHTAHTMHIAQSLHSTTSFATHKHTHTYRHICNSTRFATQNKLLDFLIYGQSAMIAHEIRLLWNGTAKQGTNRSPLFPHACAISTERKYNVPIPNRLCTICPSYIVHHKCWTFFRYWQRKSKKKKLRAPNSIWQKFFFLIKISF